MCKIECAKFWQHGILTKLSFHPLTTCSQRVPCLLQQPSSWFFLYFIFKKTVELIKPMHMICNKCCWVSSNWPLATYNQVNNFHLYWCCYSCWVGSHWSHTTQSTAPTSIDAVVVVERAATGHLQPSQQSPPPPRLLARQSRSATRHRWLKGCFLNPNSINIAHILWILLIYTQYSVSRIYCLVGSYNFYCCLGLDPKTQASLFFFFCKSFAGISQNFCGRVL